MLTSDDFRHMMDNIGQDKLTTEEVEEMLKVADVDGDGEITYQGTQFKLYLQLFFLKLDKLFTCL